jgi:prepilin-type N-terminal cleavage/methylation domain-containing protein
MRLSLPLRRAWRRLSDERGFTLSELVTTMAILGIVLGGLTGVFVSASNGEADLNSRFRAQEKGRLALEKLRRELHCASAVTPSAAATPVSSITITLGSYCMTGSGQVTWCTTTSGGRSSLFRIAGAPGTCSGGVKWADYLTTSTPFTTSAASSSTLAKIAVCLPVNTTSAPSGDTCTTHVTHKTYALSDDIFLRNSGRQ